MDSIVAKALARLKEQVEGKERDDEHARARGGMLVHFVSYAEVNPADVVAVGSLLPTAALKDAKGRPSRLAEVIQGSANAEEAKLVSVKVTDLDLLIAAAETQAPPAPPVHTDPTPPPAPVPAAAGE